jgi:hypothetical protein
VSVVGRAHLVAEPPLVPVALGRRNLVSTASGQVLARRALSAVGTNTEVVGRGVVVHLGAFAGVHVPDGAQARHRAGRIAVAVGWPQEVHRFPHRIALSTAAQSGPWLDWDVLKGVSKRMKLARAADLTAVVAHAPGISRNSVLGTSHALWAKSRTLAMCVIAECDLLIDLGARRTTGVVARALH